MNLDFAKVCGKHSAIYEAYYKQIDPKGSGAIEAMTAAKFLKKSGLSDVVLSRVWDLSDPNGKGFLDKPGFFVALKLVSLAQSGLVINMSNIYAETANPPKVGDLPKIMPARIQTVSPSSGVVATGDWSIGVIQRLKYEQLFESLKPMNNMLSGNKVKGVLMDSKLPTEILGKIWDLADQDKDGNLDKHEFIAAMHLVAQALEKRAVPDILPMELRKPGSAGPPPPKPAPPIAAMPRAPSGEGFGDTGGFVANFPKDIAPPPIVPPLVPPMAARLPPVGGTGTTPPLIGTADAPLVAIGAPPSAASNADWVVSPAELKRFEILFRTSDLDKDGLVSGLEVKNIFLQSGVPQNCLAHIWALCDTNQSGKLTLEQFALAMWLVERKQKGIEPPQVLIANMIPPSMRGIVTGVDIQPEPKPTYSNPELEMISKEIEELAKERRALELEIAQKESDIHIKKGEVRSLQGELDTLMATLKQLENQRGEAQKRLDDLKMQTIYKKADITELSIDVIKIRDEVTKIREQCQKQEETINEQEGELNAKRSELQKLKDEENSLQKEYDENNRELQKLTNHLQNTQLQISSVRSMVTQLLEVQRQMTDALLMCRAAIENQDGELVTEYQLKIEPDFDEAKKTLEKKIEEPKDDPFDDNKENVKATNGFTTNGFGNDPFTSNTVGTIRSGFDDSFNTGSGFDSGGFDAFGSNSGFGSQQKDPFGGDAFGVNKSNAITPEPGKDDFGSDPFAALHAPTGQGQVLSPNTQQKSGPPPRPESPSPALPPKKSKVPPPRPAPPRPVQGPSRPAQSDAFGSSTTGSSGFTDFADFDNKLSSVYSTATTLPELNDKLFATTSLFSTNSFNITNTNTNSNTDVIAITTATIATNPINSITTTSLTATQTKKENSLISNTNTNTNTNSIPNLNLNTIPNPYPSNLSLLASLAQDSSLNSALGGFSPTFNSTTITTTNSTTATTNNHLTRSITPTLQQAASVFQAFNNTPATNTKTLTIPTATTATTNRTATKRRTTSLSTTSNSVSGPTDFSDDPFKDYRYEDPFSIKDPFDDDDLEVTDPDKLFKDEFGNDDNARDNNNRMKTPAMDKSVTPAISNEVINQFNAFGLNSSPVPSQKSLSGSIKILPPPKSSEAVVGGDAFGNFADFDAFTAKSANSPTIISASDINAFNNNNQQAVTSSTKNDNSFFDAFNDNFINDSKQTSIFDAFGNDNNNDNIKEKQTNIVAAFNAIVPSSSTSMNKIDFDSAFGNNNGQISTATTTKSSKTFDCDDNFEDDFFAATAASNSSSIHKAVDANKNFDFDKFDAFGDCVDFPTDFSTPANNTLTMNSTKSALSSISASSSFSSLQRPLKMIHNRTTLMKLSNEDKAKLSKSPSPVVTDAGVVKLPEKFAADYSKPESFDDDLQEAIKRSMMDQ